MNHIQRRTENNFHPAILLKKYSQEKVLMKSKILVVEDNLLNQKVAKLLLEGMGYSVELAENGTQALKLFRANKYALILMDVDLPDIQGTEVTRRIRAQETNYHIPIIGCTANSQRYFDECFGSGMDDLLPKPIIINELKKLFEKYQIQIQL